MAQPKSSTITFYTTSKRLLNSWWYGQIQLLLARKCKISEPKLALSVSHWEKIRLALVILNFLKQRCSAVNIYGTLTREVNWIQSVTLIIKKTWNYFFLILTICAKSQRQFENLLWKFHQDVRNHNIFAPKIWDKMHSVLFLVCTMRTECAAVKLKRNGC